MLGDKASRGSKWTVLEAGMKYLDMPIYEGAVPEEVRPFLPALDPLELTPLFGEKLLPVSGGRFLSCNWDNSYGTHEVQVSCVSCLGRTITLSDAYQVHPDIVLVCFLLGRYFAHELIRGYQQVLQSYSSSVCYHESPQIIRA